MTQLQLWAHTLEPRLQRSSQDEASVQALGQLCRHLRVKIDILFSLLGDGLFATQDFEAGDFLLVYRGALLEKEPKGNLKYVYEFRDGSRSYW